MCLERSQRRNVEIPLVTNIHCCAKQLSNQPLGVYTARRVVLEAGKAPLPEVENRATGQDNSIAAGALAADQTGH